jgi:hypothetical protein
MVPCTCIMDCYLYRFTSCYINSLCCSLCLFPLSGTSSAWYCEVKAHSLNSRVESRLNMSSENEKDLDESHTNESSTLLEKEMHRIIQKEKLEPRAILNRFLNILPDIPQMSYLTKKHQVAIDTPSYFRSLGAGTGSQVFEVPGTSDVFKVANDPGSETDRLWNEYYMHTRLVEMQRRGPHSGFEIPK